MTYAPSTVYNYTSLIKRFIVYNGNDDLKNITIDNITRYFTYLKKHDYHDSTIAFMMIALRQMFRYLFLRKFVDWDYELISIPKYVNESYRPVGTREVDAMIEKIEVKKFIDLRNKLIILLLKSTGARNSEICGLKVDQLRIEDKMAKIVSKKSRVLRRIFWDDETNDVLVEYLKARIEYAKSPYVIIGTNSSNIGGRITTKTIQRTFAKYRLKPDAVPHGCRHGFGERGVEAEIHPRHIQIMLGHKNLDSQKIYTQMKDKSVVLAYAQMAKLHT